MWLRANSIMHGFVYTLKSFIKFSWRQLSYFNEFHHDLFGNLENSLVTDRTTDRFSVYLSFSFLFCSSHNSVRFESEKKSLCGKKKANSRFACRGLAL